MVCADRALSEPVISAVFPSVDGVDRETSVESVVARHGEQPLSADEFGDHFGDLPRDGEG